MALQLPSSSSSTRGLNYDIFLSCGTEDTLFFTSLLFEALCDRGIRTFTDLEVVDEITPALEEAIQTSRIAIVVLSKNYASSSFCLDKLSKILDHFRDKLHPVFYQVDPDDVQMLRGTDDRVKKWTISLQQVANLPGWQCGELGIECYEKMFIWKIVEEVFNKIKYVLLDVADNPVGLESRVQEVIKLLDLESDGGVQMVGIVGIGGIGKTTLVRAVHNLIAGQFEVVCFLHNVREIQIKYGLKHLQDRLLYHRHGEDYHEEGIKLTCSSERIAEVRHRLCRKKVILIVDDVDKLEQLQAVAGSPNWFGPGSRVIITSRNKNLLVSHGIERIYEVSELNDEEALDLLTYSAFKNKIAPSEFKEVLIDSVTLASGLPLSSKVIGSTLYSRNVGYWKSYLKRGKWVPDEKIQKTLEVSLDGLETMEKCVFLDIACCFKGYSLVEVQYILCAHYGYCATDYISALVRQSLINISSSGELTLHDLMRNMGKQIDRRKSPGSRLWILEEILHVFKYSYFTITDKIEIIFLDLSSTEEGKIYWDGEGFKNMGNLKTLIIKNAHFSQAPRHLPSSLRVLEWQRYPSQYLPPNFHPENLAICKLPKRCFVSSEISGLLNKPMNLDDLSFDNGEHSNEMLYVSCLPKSEEISVMVSY
ncbi:disease resistance protein Roq1-like isoform X2 [Lotus japonicus]|uniref:disease resistance protein Roq1-like isoform X2 n=1 Tax=Lotus japonicus TaxID=34305 RepID=UPI002587E1AB|nr:disease resistance protein Roq1-like isoform X2 [Lotus japonicus]